MNFTAQSKKAMLPPLVIPNNWPAAQFSPSSPVDWSPAESSRSPVASRSPVDTPRSPVESSHSQDDLEYALADLHEMEWGDQLASLAVEEDDDGP